MILIKEYYREHFNIINPKGFCHLSYNLAICATTTVFAGNTFWYTRVQAEQQTHHTGREA